MIYYRRYVGDYLRKTARISLLQHGAYCVMLDHYYTDEQPLPSDRDEIYTMVRAMTSADRKAVDSVLRKFFHKQEDGYHNDRADEEIKVAEQARENGKKGGRHKTKERTESGTETGTGEATETGTGTRTTEATGSVHPLAVNHLAFQPSSLSTDQPPSSSPASDRPPNRAAAIAVLLRNLEKDRGKAPKVTSIDPRVVAWAEQGVTDDEIREAHSLAVEDRKVKGEDAAINAGFLDVFVAKVRTPGNGTSRLNGTHSAKPWFIDSWSKIVAKGEERGIRETEYDTPAEFKVAVLKAHGVTSDEVKKAEADFR